MDNENDDVARSITGGTLFAVLFILLFLIIYTVTGNTIHDAAPLHHVKTGWFQTTGGQHGEA